MNQGDGTFAGGGSAKATEKIDECPAKGRSL